MLYEVITGATETLQLRLTRVVEGKYEVQRLLGRGGMGVHNFV